MATHTQKKKEGGALEKLVTTHFEDLIARFKLYDLRTIKIYSAIV